jgi:hypothetical protein
VQAHHVNDDCAPIAALGHELRVTEALHQHYPGTSRRAPFLAT